MATNQKPWKTMKPPWNQPKLLKTNKNRHRTMKNQSGTIKINLELDRVVMGGSGGYRRRPGGSAHFSWQTHKQNCIIIYISSSLPLNCRQVSIWICIWFHRMLALNPQSSRSKVTICPQSWTPDLRSTRPAKWNTQNMLRRLRLGCMIIGQLGYILRFRIGTLPYQKGQFSHKIHLMH